MNESLQVLSNAEEFASDIFLIHLVRLQQHVQHIIQAGPYDEPQYPQNPGAPLVIHLQSLDRTLSDFQNSVPSSLHEDLLRRDFLAMHVHSARMFLYEVGLYDEPWQIAATQKRLDMLWACSEAIISFFDVFLALAEESFFSFPYAIWGQMQDALLITSRLSILNVQGWAHGLVNENLQLPAILSRITEKLEKANALAKADWLTGESDGLIGNVLEKIDRIRRWFEEYVASERAVPGPITNQGGERAAGRDQGDVQAAAWIDDIFWEELIAECQPLQF
jgi:hypothetical protein